MMPPPRRVCAANLTKNIFFSFLFFVTSTSLTFCAGRNKPGDSKAADSSFIRLPEAKPVSSQERAAINNGCERWFSQFLERSVFNGSVLVAKNGNIIYQRSKGTVHLNSTDTITADSPFHIASVSKTFTAMAVLKLWQDGKLNIDSSASAYLPGFNYEGVTVRNLLNHRSGLPNYLYFMEDAGWDKKTFIKNEDILKWLIEKKAEIKNIGRAGTYFNYCNTNYALLALIIEKVSGKTYPDYLKSEFFIPLGMKHTFVYTAADSARITPSYDWRGVEVAANYLDDVYGDKNIYSTPSDLLLWDRLLSTNILFKPQTLEEAYKPYSNEKPGVRNYGLGWRMNIYPNGKKVIYHNGWWHGNNASFIRLTDADATIIVLGNRFCSAVYKSKYLVNIFGNYFQGNDEDETMNNSNATVSDSNEKSYPVPHRRNRRH